MTAPTAALARYGLALMLLGAAAGAVGGAYVLPDEADDHPRIPGVAAHRAAGCNEFQHLTAYGSCRDVAEVHREGVAQHLANLERAEAGR